MRVLPVMDLKRGQVVHARAGRREEYQQLRSVWTQRASDPFELTRVFREQFGATEWYLADLDSLEGHDSQTEVIGKLIERGVRLWLDAGVSSDTQAELWFGIGVERLIVASETLPSLDLLTSLTKLHDPLRMIFSLDLLKGLPRTLPGVLPLKPLEIIDEVVRRGFHQVIVLDTAAVGVAHGTVTHELCRMIRKKHPALTLISGGGVRNQTDLDQLAACGVNIALVGTALHADRDFAPAVFANSR